MYQVTAPWGDSSTVGAIRRARAPGWGQAAEPNKHVPTRTRADMMLTLSF